MNDFITSAMDLLEPAARAALWPAVAALLTTIVIAGLRAPRTGTVLDWEWPFGFGEVHDERHDVSAYDLGYGAGFMDGKAEGLREGFDEAVALETGLEGRVSDALDRIEQFDVPGYGEFGVVAQDAVDTVRRAMGEAA